MSIEVFQSYDHKYTATFLWFTVYIYSTSLVGLHHTATALNNSFVSKRERESRSRSLYVIVRSSVCRLSNIRAPYSGD